MYLPSMYYFARVISESMLQMLYPTVMLLIVIYGVAIVTSKEVVGYLILYGTLLGLVSICQGWFCGSLTDNELIAQLVSTFLTLLLMLTSGGLGSAASFPWYIAWLQYVSPLRYGFQGMIVRVF